MTDVEPQPHRSRLAWPTRTEPTTTPAGTHDHKQRNGPLLLAFLCIVLLFLVNVGLIWFILSRGETRDAREQQMRQEIREGQCDLLDAFPAAPLLDNVRREFGCGPGRAVEDFPPEVQQDLNGQAAPTQPAAPEGVETLPEDFVLPGGAERQPDRSEPYFPTPGVAEPEATIPPPPGFPPPDPVQPTGTPPPAEPLVDLEPITDRLCPPICI